MTHHKPGRPARTLLLADAAVNLALGVLLLLYPGALVTLLGLPDVESSFYPRVLGGVLVGIGVALLLERRHGRGGLGLDGAVAINLCGAGVLVVWLIIRSGDFVTAGRITLWVVALLVLGIGLVELLHRGKD